MKGVVTLSVCKADEFSGVPHFAAKATIERMIAANDLPATVLRPAISSRTTSARRPR